ncbi:MAG: hypothetical protein AAGE94_10925, partial [Acidobacteriota bacterium]
MATAQDHLEQLAAEFDQQASAVHDRDGWDALRLAWVGRKQGRLRDLMSRMKEIPADQRRDYGQGVNRLKVAVEERLDALDVELKEREVAATRAAPAHDVTMPGRRPPTRSHQPLTLVTREIEAIIAEMGYSVA